MKIIDGNLKKICQINCDCCGEDHKIIVTIDKSKNLYFEMSQSSYFWNTFRHWFNSLGKWNSYWNGTNKDFFQLILTKEMLIELYEVLSEFYSPNGDVLGSIKDNNIIYFEKNRLMLFGERDSEIFLLAIYPERKDNKWNYFKGNVDTYFGQQIASNFYKTIKEIISEE